MISVKRLNAPVTARAALMLTLTICLVGHAFVHAEATGVNSPPGPRRVVILGKVLDFKASRSGLNGSYVYRVEVTCEFRGRIKPGSEVQIEGPREMVRSETIQIPLMASGSYFVMAVEPTGNDEVFRYNSPFGIEDWLPIGTKVPAPVASVDVAGIRSALLKYGELYDQKKTLTHKEADALRESGNYFLWALGTTAVAEMATPQDARSFLAELNVGVAEKVDLKPEIRNEPGAPSSTHVILLRQAVWLVHCLSEIVPPGSRPPCAEVNAAVSRYLTRFDELANRNSFVH